ncbi:MAG: helix-turn-helix domain-containing protein [Anaerolineae bacterium]
MSLKTYIPCPPLANHVQLLWYWEGYHPPHPKERILPGGMMEITINLSEDPFRLYDAHTYLPTEQIHGAMAAGARSQPFLVDTSRAASIMAVWFKPGGALPFFGVSAAEMHNRHIPLDLLWGAEARDLYCQLLEAPSLKARFHLLEAALLRRLQQATLRHPALDYALSAFRTAHPPTVAAIVEKIALSPTRFIQLFREDIGLTPKLFSRVQRFQHALRLMTQQSTPRWTEVALQCGYYDQAHFINEFQAFAGITPTAYLPQDPMHNSNLPVID